MSLDWATGFFSNDCLRILHFNGDSAFLLQTFDLTTKSWRPDIAIAKQQEGSVQNLAWSSNGHFIYICHKERHWWKIDTSNGNATLAFQTELPKDRRTFDGETVLLVDSSGQNIEGWSLSAGKLLWRRTFAPWQIDLPEYDRSSSIAVVRLVAFDSEDEAAKRYARTLLIRVKDGATVFSEPNINGFVVPRDRGSGERHKNFHSDKFALGSNISVRDSDAIWASYGNDEAEISVLKLNEGDGPQISRKQLPLDPSLKYSSRLTIVNDSLAYMTSELSVASGGNSWLTKWIDRMANWHPDFARLRPAEASDTLLFFDPNDPKHTQRTAELPGSNGPRVCPMAVSKDGQWMCHKVEHSLDSTTFQFYRLPMRSNWLWRLLLSAAAPFGLMIASRIYARLQSNRLNYA